MEEGVEVGAASGAEATRPGLDALMAAARAVSLHAHAPYSRFRVGAAVLAEDGRVFVGCNIENASYGLALCAERTALAAGIAAGGRRFLAIAVTCPDADPQAGPQGKSPCAACRQWMLQLAPDAVVCLDGVPGQHPVRSLLPMGFRLG